MSIRLRMAAFFAIGTAAIYIVFGLVSVHLLNVGLDSSVDSDLTQSVTFVNRELMFQAAVTQFGQQPALAAPEGFRPRLSHGSPVIGQLLDSRDAVVSSIDLPNEKSLIDPSQLRAASGGTIHLDVSLPGRGGRVRVLAEPDPSLRSFVVAVGDPLGTGPDAQHGVTVALLVLFGPVVALAGIAGWLLARASLRPVETMRSRAEVISAHDDAALLPVPGRENELSGLAVTLNDLLGRMRTALRRQKAFASDAGHELRTPLAILQGELELASRPGRSPAELRQAIEEAAAEARRLSRLAEDLLLLARGDEGHMPLQIVPVELDSVVGAALSRLSSRAAEAGVSITFTRGPGVVVDGDAARLEQAVSNLLDNALRHSPAGSEVTVRVTRNAPVPTTAAAPVQSGDRTWPEEAGERTGEPPTPPQAPRSRAQPSVTVEVCDEGPGFPPEFLAHAFERFRRPDDARSRPDGGSGLGLAIVKSIAESHGGYADAENRPGGGARVWICIPGGHPVTGPVEHEPDAGASIGEQGSSDAAGPQSHVSSHIVDSPRPHSVSGTMTA